jgi:proline iminopeptidase
MPLFPPAEPLRSDFLAVGDGHRLYFECCGNPDGLPVLVLHGGPGSGASARMRQLYDPALFHTILFDQRGAGRSLPHGELHANDSAALLADIERLRRHLGIARWLVSGGSWGASLAVAYAASHPEAVRGMLIRSLFLTGDGDLHWFFQSGAERAPAAWAALAEQVPAEQRQHLLPALQSALHDANPAAARRLALAWLRYEQCLSTAVPGQLEQAPAPSDADLDRLVAKYRLQAHYFARHCFLGEERLLELAGQLRDLPVAVLHGRQDWVCRPLNVDLLQQRLPHAAVHWIDDCGHEPFHAQMAATWIGLLQRFAERGDFAG